MGISMTIPSIKWSLPSIPPVQDLLFQSSSPVKNDPPMPIAAEEENQPKKLSLKVVMPFVWILIFIVSMKLFLGMASWFFNAGTAGTTPVKSEKMERHLANACR